MIRAILAALAFSLPAHAQAPEPAYHLDCGTLKGKGAVTLVIGDTGYRVFIECGLRT